MSKKQESEEFDILTAQDDATVAVPTSPSLNDFTAALNAVLAQAKSSASAEDFAAMGRAVAQGIAANAPPRKMSFGEYQRRENKGRPTLKRECYQNGFRVMPKILSNKEIELLNQITHTGRYVNRLVECVIRDEGAEEVTEFRYNNRTRDQMFDLKGHAKNFEDILQQIVDAQKVERAENEQLHEKKEARRAFGNNAASREAREKAGV